MRLVTVLSLITVFGSAPASAGVVSFVDDDANGEIQVCRSNVGATCNLTDNAILRVDQTGLYTLTITGIDFDSGLIQMNESFFLTVKNSLNPSGAPVDPNCQSAGQSYFIVADDNIPQPGLPECDHPTVKTPITKPVGTFLLEANVDNEVVMHHFCVEALAQCPQFDRGAGPCNGGCENMRNPQSISVDLNAGYSATPPVCLTNCPIGKRCEGNYCCDATGCTMPTPDVCYNDGQPVPCENGGMSGTGGTGGGGASGSGGAGGTGGGLGGSSGGASGSSGGFGGTGGTSGNGGEGGFSNGGMSGGAGNAGTGGGPLGGAGAGAGNGVASDDNTEDDAAVVGGCNHLGSRGGFGFWVFAAMAAALGLRRRIRFTA